MELNGTLFIQIFIFVIALLWLSKSLFIPIIRLFEERDRRIKGAKIESDELNNEAQEKGHRFDVEYKKAKDKAREFLSHMKQTSEKDHAERLNKTKTEAHAKLDQSERELKEQSQQIRARLDTDAAHLATKIVDTLVNRHA